MPDVGVRIGTLPLPNPVLAAAGTYGYGLEFARAAPLDQLGGLITKTLTRQPREGHPPPRLVETPSGMLNAVGLQNIGLEAFLQEKLPALRMLHMPLIVSILGEDDEDVAVMAQQLDQAKGVAAIELNLSCPNIKDRSRLQAPSSKQSELQPAACSLQLRMVAQDPEATEAIVRVARQRTRKPLIAKLSPDVTDLAPIIQAAEQAGADALTITNTFTGMSLDPHTRRSRLGALTGGLSGPAIRPLAVYRVWYTAQLTHLPIIGLGGIRRAEDAVEFFLAGASAIAVGTANFADPRAPMRILRGLLGYLKREGLSSIDQLRGALRQS